VHPGDIPVRILKDGPYTHRIRNVGKDTFDVFDVEVLRRPEHPSSSVAAPVAAETPEARVYKWTLAPGAVSPMHTHERPYIIVAATAFPLKMTTPDGQSMTHEIKPGDFHWVTSKVTHSLANEGSKVGQIVEIELK
jgi:quercetin dioxygenase-like cupin family protein